MIHFILIEAAERQAASSNAHRNPKGTRGYYSWPAPTMEADQRYRRMGGRRGGGLRCRAAPPSTNNGRSLTARGKRADVEQISGRKGRHGCGILAGSGTPLLSITLFLCFMPLPGKIIWMPTIIGHSRVNYFIDKGEKRKHRKYNIESRRLNCVSDVLSMFCTRPKTHC